MADETTLGALFCGVNTPKDPANLSDLEKKHTPVITAPDVVRAGECFEVTAEVGKLLAHPNEPGHAIEFIELYAGHTYIAHLDLTAVRTCPILKISVALEKELGPLRVFERCNLHGIWEISKPICVEQK
jgi:superoxide reductase